MMDETNWILTGVEEKSDADRVSQNKIRMNDQQKTDWHWHAANRYATLAGDTKSTNKKMLFRRPPPQIEAHAGPTGFCQIKKMKQVSELHRAPRLSREQTPCQVEREQEERHGTLSNNKIGYNRQLRIEIRDGAQQILTNN